MKNLIKTLVFALVAIAFTSCEEDLRVYPNDNFVQLVNSSAVSITENGGDVVSVDVVLGAPRSTDVNVSFDVTTAAPATRYALSGSSLTIPAGETNGSITFSAVDNDDIDGDFDVVFTLSSSSDIPVGIGGEAVNAVSKTITVVDDNVPCNDYTLTINTDTYGDETFWDILDSSGATVASGGTYDFSSAGGETYTEAFTLADGCYTLRMFDFWGDNGPSYVLSCGSLTPVDDSDGLGGIPGLNLSTVPSPGFRNGGSPPDHVGFSDSHDFCVNQ